VGLLVAGAVLLFWAARGAWAQESAQANTPSAVLDFVPDSQAKVQAGFAADFDSVRLDVPLIMQKPELPTGCEATATAMMLQYAGAPLTKFDVVAVMPYSDDPYRGFVGDPYGDSGFTMYPSALMPLVREQLGSAIDLTGAPLEELLDYVRAEKPVCCWIADDRGYVHCVVLTGFEGDTVYINDSLEGFTSMSAAEFEHLRANNAYRALSY
jgi:uncharacterized protein YvpB